MEETEAASAVPREVVGPPHMNNTDPQQATGIGTMDMQMNRDEDSLMDRTYDDVESYLVGEYRDQDGDGERQRPVGTYDPFDDRFPRNKIEEAWGESALEFIWDTLQTREHWDYMIESICEPFSGWDGDYSRTRN